MDFEKIKEQNQLAAYLDGYKLKKLPAPEAASMPDLARFAAGVIASDTSRPIIFGYAGIAPPANGVML